jgi:hypothetical protein
MKLTVTPTAILLLAGVAAAGYAVWRAAQKASGLIDGVGQSVAQAAATVQSGWNNNIAGPFAEGWNYGTTGETPYRGEKAWLYDDYHYTGIDPATGLLVTDGEWYSDAVARRYDAEQRASGTPPAATSIDGAAFGIYPRAF